MCDLDRFYFSFVLIDIERLWIVSSVERGFYDWAVMFFPSLDSDPQIQALTCFTCGEYILSSEDICDRIACKCIKNNCELCEKIFVRNSNEDEIKCQDCGGDICSSCENDRDRCWYCNDYYCTVCYLAGNFRLCNFCNTYLCDTCKDEKCDCRYQLEFCSSAA